MDEIRLLGPAAFEEARSHSLLWHLASERAAREGMAAVLAAIEVKPLKFGVIANVNSEVNRDPRRVVPLLLEQITAPVKWEESMATLGRLGIDSAIEFGCGRVLAGLMRRIDKNVKVLPCEDLKSLRNAGSALGG